MSCLKPSPTAVAKKIKLVIAEDNALQRLLLRKSVQQIGLFDLVYEAENGLQLIDKIEVSHELPEVCITDMEMPVMNGIDLSGILTARFPSIQIYCFTSSEDPIIFSQLLQNGVRIIFGKEDPHAMLTEIYRLVTCDLHPNTDQNVSR